ncbi:MAG: DUF4139 domain-containing protein [Solirubrobacterales bacterium]
MPNPTKPSRLAVSISALAACALIPLALYAETVSGPGDRTGLTVTVTQDDVGLISDRRSLTLDKGSSLVAIEGVAREVRPGSARLTAPGVAVREQGLELGGIEASLLLAKSVGREVTVVWRDSAGGEREERVTVLSAGPVPVFRAGGKVVAGTPVRVLYDALPPGLRPLPAYTASVSSDTAGKREAELTYAAAGLSWQADYTADLVDDKLMLSAWATVTNASGLDLPEAKLQVLAGAPAQAAKRPRPVMMARAEATMAAPEPMAPERQAAGPHHLYAIGQTVTLRDGESRQVALLPPAALAVERVLTLDPMPPQAWRGQWREPEARHPMMALRFKNTLGQPLPAGIVRIGQKGVPLGEDHLAAVPDGGQGRIAVGEMFDVTARRQQTDFQRVAPDVTEAAWEVRLANGGDRSARVVVREAFAGDWLVVDESEKHVKDGAFSAAWTITVPAKGEAVLKYRARVKG